MSIKEKNAISEHKIDTYNGIKFINTYNNKIDEYESQKLKKQIFDIAKKYR